MEFNAIVILDDINILDDHLTQIESLIGENYESRKALERIREYIENQIRKEILK